VTLLSQERPFQTGFRGCAGYGLGGRRVAPRRRQIAFWTLPPLRQRVQTYARVALPLSRTRTRWRFGLKRRFVATMEWLRLLPKPGFFPQTAQTLDMSGAV
jgi:hypothetical protein